MPLGNKVTRLKEQCDNYKKLDYSYDKPEPINPYYGKVITINGFFLYPYQCSAQSISPSAFLYDLCSVYAYLTSTDTSGSVKLGGDEIW